MCTGKCSKRLTGRYLQRFMFILRSVSQTKNLYSRLMSTWCSAQSNVFLIAAFMPEVPLFSSRGAIKKYISYHAQIFHGVHAITDLYRWNQIRSWNHLRSNLRIICGPVLVTTQGHQRATVQTVNWRLTTRLFYLDHYKCYLVQLTKLT